MMITSLDITDLRNAFLKVSLSCFKTVSKSVQSFLTDQAKAGGGGGGEDEECVLKLYPSHSFSGPECTNTP